MSAFTDLAVGDYVVHENHGIGRYMGTVRLASEGTLTGFFAHPVHGLGQAVRAHGPDGPRAEVHRPGGGETRASTRLSGRRMAAAEGQGALLDPRDRGELVKLYAARTSATGYAFSRTRPGSGSSRNPSSTRRPRTSFRPSRKQAGLERSRRSWIGCTAATWATARPRWRSAPSSSASGRKAAAALLAPTNHPGAAALRDHDQPLPTASR